MKPPCVVPGSGRHFLIYENLVLDQDKIYLVRLSILITYLLDDVWILQGEVTF